jgi:hypothetical protein
LEVRDLFSLSYNFPQPREAASIANSRIVQSLAFGSLARPNPVFLEALAQDPVDAKKKRPAFPAERFCVAQRMR